MMTSVKSGYFIKNENGPFNESKNDFSNGLDAEFRGPIQRIHWALSAKNGEKQFTTSFGM